MYIRIGAYSGMRTYDIQGRYDYYGIDEHYTRDSGVYESVTVKSRKDAAKVAALANHAFAAGVLHGLARAHEGRSYVFEIPDGDSFRITPGRSFVIGDGDYRPVDVRCTATGTEAQAIVPVFTFPLHEDSLVQDAMRSAARGYYGDKRTVPDYAAIHDASDAWRERNGFPS